jgi:hypothetical protein
MELRPFMSRQQVAQLLNISTKTLNRLCKAHNIELPPGLLSPSDQTRLFQRLGATNDVPKTAEN